MIHIALSYWSAYPDEVEALMEHADRAEAEGSAAAERTRGLLNG